MNNQSKTNQTETNHLIIRLINIKGGRLPLHQVLCRTHHQVAFRVALQAQRAQPHPSMN